MLGIRKWMPLASLIAFVGSLVGCGGKGQSSHVTHFILQSKDAQVRSDKITPVSLDRSKPMDGDDFNILPDRDDDVTAATTEITCGPTLDGKMLTIKGPQKASGDKTLFTFRLSIHNFPDLMLLPMQTSCNLDVTLTNSTGSTRKDQFPLNIQFQEGQPVVVTRSIPVRGIPQMGAELSFIMEQFDVSNTMPYSMDFIYINELPVDVAALFNGSSGAPWGVLFNVNLKFSYLTKEIYLSGGMPLIKNENPPLVFRLQPHESATLKWVVRQSGALPPGTLFQKYSGAYFWTVGDPKAYPGLYTYRGFAKTSDYLSPSSLAPLEATTIQAVPMVQR